MLRSLYIRHFVTVESLELDLDSGMTTLTGETGAGKSILVDALGLILGDKADASLIRPGADKAEITAEFSIETAAMHEWLQQQDLHTNDSLLLRRVLTSNGRSKAYINDSPVTLAQLAELSGQLIDVHGQHAHQSLGSRQHQRELLDGFAKHQKLCDAVADHWRSWQQSSAQLQQLITQQRTRSDQITLLRFQLQELEQLLPVPGEWQQLEAQHKRLANAQELISSAGQLDQLLYDDAGVEEQLQRAEQLLGSLSTLDDNLNEPHALVRSALIEIQEAAGSIRSYAESVELDPQQLAQIDARLGLYHALAKKYQREPDELAAFQQDIHTALSQLDQADDNIAALKTAVAEQASAWQQAAAALTKARTKAAKQLGKLVSEQMQQLAMPHGCFVVTLKAVESDQPLQHGMETIAFLVSANPGMEPQPLAKIASGGELSRISLAIQVITAGVSQVETLVFDEVDVGIGGGTAEIVGELLRQLGQQRQVLCVTHLPQVAAQAHQHWRVDKVSDKAQTRSVVLALDDQERVEEIARMLGGVTITQRTRDHAAEMLATAKQK
jgi:DNA repair protein RecN (Recombination protein N)